MARPQKEGLDYFPHDTDADSDPKIQAMIYLYGNDGYAFYFRLLQRIYRSSSGSIDVSDAETKQILARNISVTMQKFDKMLATSIKKGLFDGELFEKSGQLSSNGIRKRLSVVLGKRAEMKARYEQKRIVSTPVSDAETKQKPDKVKEKVNNKEKVNKNKNKDILILPDWIDKELWSDFLEVRRVKKAPNTNRAIKLLITELTGLRDLGAEPQKIIEQSIKGGWTGFYPLKENKNAANSKDIKQHYSTQFSTNYENPDTYFKKQGAANV